MNQASFQHQVRRLAYDRTEGIAPGVVFLGGFRSDKEGTKALFLEGWAKETGRAFLRFDYSGHGSSSGDILDYAISDWAQDAEAIILGLTAGPQILVGSSMGGWIAMLLARRRPDLVAGLVTIAAAPDFTEDKYFLGMSDEDRAAFEESGQISVPSEYSEDPYVITRYLIEDGRRNLIFGEPLPLSTPARFLQGTEDRAVSVATAQRLFDHADGADIQLRLVTGADHRFSEPDNLAMIRAAVEDVIDRQQ